MNNSDMLAGELEAIKPLTPRTERMLYDLDCLEMDGTSKAEWSEKADQIRLAHLLHGDFELIIDQCLGGDQELKWRVMQADIDDRRGLAVLKHHLSKRNVEVNGDPASALRSLEKDQEFYESRTSDLRNIEPLPSGSYRVRIKGKKKTFTTLLEACSYRDLVASRFSGSRESKNPQMGAS